MEKILIKNVRVIDPSQKLDEIMDILAEDTILSLGKDVTCPDATVIDGTGLCAAPGFVDIHVHLRDPGFEYKEDILTGCAAAAAGGVTSLCCMPNTKPAIDTPETIAYILEKAKKASARVYPVAAITKGLQGETLVNFAELKAAGAIGFSDDGRPVESGGMMMEALEKAYAIGIPVISHCEDLSIINGGIIHAGKVSEQLGVKGMHRASEDSITAREIVLAESTGTAVHIAHVSTRGSVQLIREAKARGVQVTAETAPHYLTFTEDNLLNRNANFRMNPPLREQSDCDALLEGLRDGTIDAIVTDHAPHSPEEKADFLKAPNGIIGMETSFAAACSYLVHEKGMSLTQLVNLMSTAPASLMHLPGGTLKVGAPADIVLFQPDRRWVVSADNLHGKSRNTPYHGMELTGKVIRTILGGRTVYQESERDSDER